MWCDTLIGLVLNQDLEAKHLCFVEKILENYFIGENSSNRPVFSPGSCVMDHQRGDLVTSSLHLLLYQEKQFSGKRAKYQGIKGIYQGN
jgi:hypothetical protein